MQHSTNGYGYKQQISLIVLEAGKLKIKARVTLLSGEGTIACSNVTSGCVLTGGRDEGTY